MTNLANTGNEITSFKSKKEFFDAAEGKAVLRTIVNGFTADDWDAFLENTLASLTAQGCRKEDIVVDEKGLSIKSTGQFWLKPKTPRVMKGSIHVRSKDFYFKNDDIESYCDKSKTTLFSDGPEKGLQLTTLQGSTIRYTIQ